jgi:hypothetical protein
MLIIAPPMENAPIKPYYYCHKDYLLVSSHIEEIHMYRLVRHQEMMVFSHSRYLA